jgi:hypothetical protein
MNTKALAAWIQEKTDSHSTGNAAVLYELKDFGIEVEFKKDHNAEYALLSYNGNEIRIYLMTWKGQLEAQKLNSRMGFCVIKPDAERDIEYFYYNDRPVKNFDADGNPRVARNTKIYAVVKNPEQVPMFCGYMFDTPEARERLNFSGGYLAQALDRLITGRDASSGLTGRGFSFSANVQHIAQYQEA